ncbi:glycine-rich domain-containing protein [Sphaerisporangium dianthi]|uniref:Glycine-rich domain-containing protein n=1 Tax=Sphaerisporangium dianthi TaxID=1436120 RepID=A0ABV9CRI2_9ACTN
MTALTDRSAITADPRTLIPPDLFSRLAESLARRENLTAGHAERIMEQALAFLLACGLNPGARLSPSPEIDKGWHTFLTYTREYAAFCSRVAGRFIHHTPDDAPDAESASRPETERIGRTIETMRAAGLPVDAELWIPSTACSQCHQGCYDDPGTEG